MRKKSLIEKWAKDLNRELLKEIVTVYMKKIISLTLAITFAQKK